VKPILVTKRDLIKNVANRWREQYPEVNSGKHSRFVQTYRDLLALDLGTCTADEVDAVIGNSSWTRNECQSCGDDVDAAVIVGQEPDYESATARLCKSCLQAALDLLK
jgi:hypothetical protein